MSGNDKKIDEAVISEERAETAISESETEQLSENKNGDCENHNDGSENDTVQTCTELAVIDLENTEKKSLIFDKIKKIKEENNYSCFISCCFNYSVYYYIFCIYKSNAKI